MAEFQNGEPLTLGRLLSPSMWHPILGDFEEIAQEPVVLADSQPLSRQGPVIVN